MSQINVNGLTFYYEGSFDNIFEDVSFSIDTNWKLGFIGRNGKGKTTFLNLLLGKYSYRGSIDSSVRFEYFPYVITAEQAELTASEFICDIKPDCEEWRVICELSQLRENADLLYRPFKTLSHGERTKVLLAVLFSGENDFLLIDEPTNHLDAEARETVKEYLASKKGFILVSHDRDLLDACTDHVLVLNRRSIEVQSGNFTSWWENKQKRDQFAIAENEKDKKEIKKLRQAAKRTSEWADKNESTKIGFDPIKEHDRCISTRAFIGAKTKKMQSRVKQMEKRIDREIEEKEGLLNDLERTAELKLSQLAHHKNTLINIRDYSVKYPTAEEPVFTGLDLEVKRGDRIALHGGNGCGKSTLIHSILQKAGYSERGADITENGICETASGLIISYVDQDTSGLRGSISEYCDSRVLDLSMFCTILRQLNLERAQLAKKIEEFSEGQKKKVLLATSLLTPAHIYIWDEPLNYIDVFSRIQLEELLLSYEPTMLFVEHDVRFREKIATAVKEM
ncbi:ribosomal protection-like ABC-F family protein [Ruminococcus flavefaciens]|uniref:ribosomal protection-like ABC-F family protein n=1 Tax=Ruminococcus flavefaciens TaxID=1265 RepID=UPI0013DB83FA|nr:ABC-F family ATP-binding cassette domain-containing protein [Ruminococcus flavefaciens]